MPELPEVEVIRRGLLPHIRGQRLSVVYTGEKSLRYPYPALTTLIGRQLVDLQRRSKYLLFRFDDGQVLLWHLGMSGHFHIGGMTHPPRSHEHVRLDWSNGCSLRYCDARRFGYLGLSDRQGLEQHAWLRRLGPEPLQASFDADYLFACCHSRRAPIKHVVMDASVVVGVGNIYAAESLFRSGIHPARASNRIAYPRIAALCANIKTVLQEAIAAGGSSIRDFIHIDGSSGYFAHDFHVYGRQGQACFRCGRTIRRIVQQGRSSCYCPGCQH